MIQQSNFSIYTSLFKVWYPFYISTSFSYPYPLYLISQYGVEPLLYILILWGVLSKNIPQYYHISTIKNRILWWKYYLSIHIMQSYLILPSDNYFISTAYFLSIINSNIFITRIVISSIKQSLYFIQSLSYFNASSFFLSFDILITDSIFSTCSFRFLLFFPIIFKDLL